MKGCTVPHTLAKMSLMPLSLEAMRMIKMKKADETLQEFITTIYENVVRTLEHSPNTMYRHPIPEKKGVYGNQGQLIERVNSEQIQYIHKNLHEIMKRIQDLFPECLVEMIARTEAIHNQHIQIDWSKQGIEQKRKSMKKVQKKPLLLPKDL